MRNIVNSYVEKFRQERRKKYRTYGLLLALALVVTAGVAWQLRSTGVAMTNVTSCGLEEHQHDESCYEQVLVCGLETSEGHTHRESCYDEEGNLICGLEESEGHTHTEGCYETQLACGLEEHTHTTACMSDVNADLETADDWEETLPELSGILAEDIVAIAESQLGYMESTSNFILADDGETRQGYTRYGAWYGNEYGAWDAMFASFCLYYAGVDESAFPEFSGAYAWTVKLNELGLYADAAEYVPVSGDLVFFDADEDGKADHVGIAADVSEDTLTVIEGDYADADADVVCMNEYSLSDSRIMGYGMLPRQENADTGGIGDKEETDAADGEATATTIESGADGEEADSTNGAETTDGSKTTEGENGEEQTVLTCEGEDYIITVRYGVDAELPDDVELVVSEYDPSSVTYELRYEEAAVLYGWDEEAENDFRLFHIGLYVDDAEVEPAAEVKVTISYTGKDGLTEYNVTHYGEEETETMNAESDYADGTQSVTFITDGFSDYGTSPVPTLLTASNSATDLCYVSALVVQTVIDGTEPFDDDNDAGNDHDDSNGIVRSFDYVNYTLQYVTALRDTSVTVDSADLMVSFELDCDPSVAEFNTDTLNWCQDLVVTYYYSDDTRSTTWDSGKTVTKQVLTGYRTLSVDESGNLVIPGSGTLSVGIYVKAAENGTILQPAFTVWMEGNDETEYQSVESGEIIVSAVPRYNIYLSRNSDCDYIGYWNFTSGTVSSTQTSSDEVYGRMEGYGIVIQLYNTSADKGLKGIELPSGNITFTVTFTAILDNTDVTAEDDYAPLLWDYSTNTNTNNITTKVGELGRSMCFGNDGRKSCDLYTAGASGGGAGYCYESGTWTVTQTGNVLSVTISGYEFDMEDYTFPTRGMSASSQSDSYGANVGCFSAGYIQVLASFPDSVDADSTYKFTANVANMSAISVTGKSADAEVVTNDNTDTITLALYTKGTIQKSQLYFDATGSSGLYSYFEYGDAYSYQGAEITIASRIYFQGDGIYTSFNLLQKFDDKAMKVVPEANTGYLKYVNGNSLSKIDSITVLYAAKPDGSGWISDQEMNEAQEENLIYFSSYDDLVDAGYICVGFLYEVRGTFYPLSNSYVLGLYMKMEVKDSAEIGSVYQTVNTLRCWRSDNAASWTTIPYTGNANLISGVYGLGDKDWTATSVTSHDDYATGYNEPDSVRYNSSGDATQIDTYMYTKVTYENGTIASGHTGGYHYGNSLLIVGCQTGVSITVADKTTTTSGATTAKSIYDLDTGERTVNYTVTPTVTVASGNSSAQTSGDTTNVTVTVTLPEGLTYIMDSASTDPYSVTKNADGTTTIIWELYDVSIGAGLNDITFSCTIGAAGTANDVENNEKLTVSAAISSDKDSREYTTANGNCSETTISVIKLATSSISKSVASNLLEVGEDITYELHYGNSAATAVSEVELLDILPCNNDGRGTSYTGAYTLKSVTVDFSNAEDTYAAVKNTITAGYTADADVQTVDKDDILVNQSSSISFTNLGTAAMDDTAMTVTWSGLNLSGVQALYLTIGTVESNEYITVRVTLSVVDGNGDLLKDTNSAVQQPGSVYGNDFYQYAAGQAAVVESNTVKTTVVQRDISGLVWKDADRDGAREDGEALYAGLTVSLYRTSASDYDTAKASVATVNGVTLYTAYNVLGQAVSAVTTDSVGAYSFTQLEAGTYYIVVTGGGSDPITDYGLTIQNSASASSDNFDSDAAGTLSGDRLENAYMVVTLHETEQMSGYHEVSRHNDAGLALAELVIKKVNESNQNTTLAGAVFTLTDSTGNTYYGSDGTISATEVRLTSETDGLVTVDGLKPGTYTLTEVQAPDGYNLPTDNTWTVTVKAVEDTGAPSWLTLSYISDTVASTSSPYVITNISGVELPLTGGAGTLPFTMAGLLLIGGATYLLYRNRRQYKEALH